MTRSGAGAAATLVAGLQPVAALTRAGYDAMGGLGTWAWWVGGAAPLAVALERLDALRAEAVIPPARGADRTAANVGYVPGQGAGLSGGAQPALRPLKAFASDPTGASRLAMWLLGFDLARAALAGRQWALAAAATPAALLAQSVFDPVLALAGVAGGVWVVMSGAEREGVS